MTTRSPVTATCVRCTKWFMVFSLWLSLARSPDGTRWRAPLER